MFADVEHACARLGFDPNPREIWEIACALGVHRPTTPDGPERIVRDELVGEMVNAELASRTTGERPQWGNPRSGEMN